MNKIAWDWYKRNSLYVETVSTLTFLALNGPPLEKFDPLPHVRSWLERGHRESTAWVSGRLGHRVPVIFTSIITLSDVCCLSIAWLTKSVIELLTCLSTDDVDHEHYIDISLFIIACFSQTPSRIVAKCLYRLFVESF